MAGSSVEVGALGLRVRFESEEAELLAAARSAYGPPPGADRPEAAESPAARIQLRLAEAPPTGDPGPAAASRAPLIRVAGDRLLITRGGGIRAEADARAGTAWAAVPERLLEDPATLAESVLDTLTLFLLTRRGRIPVHAAAFVRGGTAAVLAGRSGSGKSTLALHALRAGWPVLTDDAVYVQLPPVPRIWALPRPLHVLPGDPAAAVSPERAAADRSSGPGRSATDPAPALTPGRNGAVADAAAWPAGRVRMRHGRLKRAIHDPGPRAEGGSVPARLDHADRAALFVLERGGSVALAPLGIDEAAAALAGALEPGFDVFRHALPEAVRVLAAAGAWRLTLGRDPAAALHAIAEVLG